MAKKRGSYNTGAKIKLSDQDRADHYSELLNKEMAVSPNLAPIVYALRGEKLEIQRLVIRTLLPPKIGKHGHPKRKFPDDAVLEAVETAKSELEKLGQSKITDRAAAKFLLENWTRMGRLEGAPFKPDSTAGKQEVDRIIAAAGRARNAKQSKLRLS
jgi:hypothetical protein